MENGRRLKIQSELGGRETERAGDRREDGRNGASEAAE